MEDGEVILTQSGAIIEYLEEIYPEPPLLPKTQHARAHVRAMTNLIMCEMQPLNNLGTLKYLKDVLGHDPDDVSEWIQHFHVRGFSCLEEFVKKYGGPDGYCFGNTVTLADVFLFPQLWNAHRFECDLRPYENLKRIEKKLHKVEAFYKALPENQLDAP